MKNLLKLAVTLLIVFGWIDSFLNSSENDDWLYLEWETDIKKAIVYVRIHIDYKNMDLERFARAGSGSEYILLEDGSIGGWGSEEHVENDGSRHSGTGSLFDR